MTERISYSDAGGTEVTPSLSMTDRLLGALLGSVGVLLSIILGPMIIWWNLGGDGFWLFFGSSPLNYWLMLWSSWVAIVAFVAGLLAGYDRTLTFMSHLWFTADEPNFTFSVLLWLILLALGAITFWTLMSVPASAFR